ncbi:unnamed protein product [Fusarium equiseti]|uniref:Methyltransferase n=1 Tax=Fusarium equiseti TaxID=61235 RepID=A0A8J2NAQ1_FUSEQ|nr:unnamed protein product [Fusarium equiseti]
MSSPKTPRSPASPEDAHDPAVRPEDGPIEPVSHYFSPMFKVCPISLCPNASYRTPILTLRIQSHTESLKSSIMEYKWVHGRRFHAYGDGTYWGANDDRQQEAEDLMYVIHELFRIVLGGKLYQAPIGNSPQVGHVTNQQPPPLTCKQQNILDVGCGTGTWAM